MIGYLVEQELGNLLPFERPLATILTMVEVDPDDPAFADPTKFVGPIYDKATADAARRREGLGGQAGRRRTGGASCRRRGRSGSSRSGRCAGSLEHGAVVICAGGGGIPTMYVPGRGAPPRRRRGGHRQGPRQQPARARARRRPLRDGDRRRRRVHRLGQPDPGAHRPDHAGRARRDGLPGRLDGTEGRGRDRVRDGHRQARRHRVARATSTRWSPAPAARSVTGAIPRHDVTRRPLRGRQAAPGHRPPAGPQPQAADPGQPRRAAVRRRPVGRARPVGARPVRGPDARARRRGASTSRTSSGEALAASDEARQRLIELVASESVVGPAWSTRSAPPDRARSRTRSPATSSAA